MPWDNYPLAIGDGPSWLPDEDSRRAGAYDAYESIYWSEDSSYTLRVLVTEQPIYVPNARLLCDTISHYLMKGVTIGLVDPEKNQKASDRLQSFLDQEMFYSKFHVAKHAGTVRGDFVLHLTGDPDRPDGQKLAITSVHPGKVVRKFDDDDGDAVTEVWICESYVDPTSPNIPLVKRLHYWYEDADTAPSEDLVPGDLTKSAVTTRVVYSEEEILRNDNSLWSDNEKLYQTISFSDALPGPIDTIPVYWFKNVPWDGIPFGSSDIRGFERPIRGISQASTDVSVSLALDGMGLYATDAPPPRNADGSEANWAIEPGQIVEVPNGNYFKRVEGVGTITPVLDQIAYLESKIYQAGGLTSISIGDIDSATAGNAMALAIKFMPTVIKVSEREHISVGRLKQLFYDWMRWEEAYEDFVFAEGVEIEVKLGDKLPQDRTERINELNNMLDRDIISRAYYRQEMAVLGYEFPDDIEQQVNNDREKDLEFNTPTGQLDNVAAETAAAAGTVDPIQLPQGVNGQKSTTLPKPPSTSNNSASGQVNESKGTEAKQNTANQARGGKRRAKK